MVTRAPSVAGSAPGSRVRLAISQIDLLDISFHAELIELLAAPLLDTPADTAAAVS
jgi:exoribonuclease-2